MHPSDQIKSLSVKTICLLMKDKQLLDLYSKVLPIIKRHVKTICLHKIMTPEGFEKYLNHQVSRFSFDLGIGKFYFTSRESLLLSIRDKKILCLIQELLDLIPKPQLKDSEGPSKPLLKKTYPIRNLTDSEDYDGKFEDLSQFVEKYYYGMQSCDLDIKRNESNYGMNKTQRHPKKSAFDIYYQELFNSVKGLTVVENEAFGGVRASMIK